MKKQDGFKNSSKIMLTVVSILLVVATLFTIGMQTTFAKAEEMNVKIKTFSAQPESAFEDIKTNYSVNVSTKKELNNFLNDIKDDLTIEESETLCFVDDFFKNFGLVFYVVSTGSSASFKVTNCDINDEELIIHCDYKNQAVTRDIAYKVISVIYKKQDNIKSAKIELS